MITFNQKLKRMNKLSPQKKIGIPESFQGILWSKNIKNLDLKRDKAYIIHQVLSYGTLEQIRWLLKVYGKKEVRKVFEEAPMRVYCPSTFNFIKNIILGLKRKTIPSEKYVTTLY